MMISVQEMTHENIAKVYKCGKRNLPIYYSQYDLSMMSMFPQRFLIVDAVSHKMSGNNVVGYLVGEYKNKENRFHIMSFGVDNAYRRKGVGTKILNYIKKRHDFKCTSLYVHAANKNAIAFYAKNGFVSKKIMKNYYKESLKDSETNDAFYMQYTF